MVDDLTVDITLNGTYPLLLNDLTNIHIFDKDWMVENGAELPTDIGSGVEGYATYNANGTGPFIVESRQPDAKTVFVVNPDWGDEPQHNLDRIELTPVTSAATRVALSEPRFNMIFLLKLCVWWCPGLGRVCLC